MSRAVEICSRHEAFGAQTFGHWVRVLIGQVNRGQYRFVLGGASETKDRPVGFAGWFRTTRTEAERWLCGTGTGVQDPTGDCIVLNALIAEEPGVLRAILTHAETFEPGPFQLYAKRAYPDGRIRPVRLPVSAGSVIPRRTTGRS